MAGTSVNRSGTVRSDDDEDANYETDFGAFPNTPRDINVSGTTDSKDSYYLRAASKRKYMGKTDSYVSKKKPIDSVMWTDSDMDSSAGFPN